jgi:hypothetical protein
MFGDPGSVRTSSSRRLIETWPNRDYFGQTDFSGVEQISSEKLRPIAFDLSLQGLIFKVMDVR